MDISGGGNSGNEVDGDEDGIHIDSEGRRWWLCRSPELINLEEKIIDLKTKIIDLKTKVVDLKTKVVDLKKKICRSKYENHRSEVENHRSEAKNRTSEAEIVDLELTGACVSDGGGSPVVVGVGGSPTARGGRGWWLVATSDNVCVLFKF
ncbi:unnamed protein product [Lactuca virosa]|uniref:Uncharacterized protein n=1 Tax=Lactuca virosa TaxID=75947 RepID=A0AAU9LY87_9ASTR|nr:unnamed protein product [Lactuca virosa]